MFRRYIFSVLVLCLVTGTAVARQPQPTGSSAIPNRGDMGSLQAGGFMGGINAKFDLVIKLVCGGHLAKCPPSRICKEKAVSIYGKCLDLATKHWVNHYATDIQSGKGHVAIPTDWSDADKDRVQKALRNCGRACGASDVVKD